MSKEHAKHDTSGEGQEEPSKTEQRAALKAANEAKNATKPAGTRTDELGNTVGAFEDETEYERSIRVNGEPPKSAKKGGSA